MSVEKITGVVADLSSPDARWRIVLHGELLPVFWEFHERSKALDFLAQLRGLREGGDSEAAVTPGLANGEPIGRPRRGHPYDPHHPASPPK